MKAVVAFMVIGRTFPVGGQSWIFPGGQRW